MNDPIITSRRRTALSPWLTLVERMLGDSAGNSLGTFHSFDQADYVNILAVTAAKEVVLVEQYRAAREGRTLELPGGLLDPGEEPVTCAVRELAEETGYAASEPLLLGRLSPDPGRLDNRVWCYYARAVTPIAGWQAEPGVIPRLVSRDAFVATIQSGEFEHAMHVGIVGLALLRGLF